LLFLAVSTWIGYVLFQQVRAWAGGSGAFPNLPGRSEEGTTDARPSVAWQPWQGTDRVNVLVLGVDERQNEEGPWRTDTMIILTIDPLTKSGGMLSIPRDLWVPIPDPDDCIPASYSEGRINTAHYLGDIFRCPGGGPAVAMDTVEYNLGVPIHYYVRLNFSAFVELVDLIGGIDIHVREEINDPFYPSSDPEDPYGYDPLHIPAGWVTMDGELALKYARTRHTNGGDFDRAERQQQVLRTILEKVSNYNLLLQLIPRAPQMWETLSDSVQTDLTLTEIVALARLATDVPRENIHAAVIDEECTMFWETPNGQQVLVPVRDCMRELRGEVFTSDPATGEEDPTARLAAEAATVEVRNGAGVSGLAQEAAAYLQEHGIQEVHPSNADRFDYTESLIYVYTDKTFTAETIAQLLDLPPASVVTISDPQAETDITVILGANFQLPTR
jgi:LCP family protein required for cell wall assembly